MEQKFNINNPNQSNPDWSIEILEFQGISNLIPFEADRTELSPPDETWLDL